jgi:hypothetical protein
MSFVFKKGHSYFWPVAIETPLDGGKHKKETIDLKFQLKKQSEIESLLKAEGATDKAFCEAIVIGWKDIKDEAGQAVEFSDEALKELLEVPQLAKTIVMAYLESVAGAKAKN